MEIVNAFGKNSHFKKKVVRSDASLMLAKEGSYLWTGIEPSSRYQGWFLDLGKKGLVKIIEDIRFQGREVVSGMIVGLENIKKTGLGFCETLYLPERSAIICESDKFASVEIFFDIKDPYESPEFGRNYRVWKEDGAIIVNFTQENGKIPEIFAAIWGDFGIIEIKEEWIKHDYDYDRVRGDKPFERWVFKPAKILASRIAVAAALTKDEAINKVREAWSDRLAKKNGELSLIFNSELDAAQQAAARALAMLKVKKNGKSALRAGLPWFFQIWRRDEAVSLKGLSLVDPAAAIDIFWRQIEELAAEDFKYRDSVDAIGWLFLRAGEFIDAGKFGIEETKRIFGVLEKSIEKLLVEDTKNDLAVHGLKQTWMDSLERRGAAIEIQALRLRMYALAARIADTEEKKNYYYNLEAAAWIRIRDKFFQNGKLADIYNPVTGRADFKVRPNVFLAAYAYPELLKKSEWAEVFDNTLEKLWLDWGGLSTLDKKDAGFCGSDTGVDPTAYHNGDSWFWVNNLAAVVLNRFDREKYENYINKIFEASANDILWHGAIGCASEISSAEKYASAGCVNQAWSNATFLELAAELKR